jgi:hypothetical protein
MAGTLLDHPGPGRLIAWLPVSGRIPKGSPLPARIAEGRSRRPVLRCELFGPWRGRWAVGGRTSEPALRARLRTAGRARRERTHAGVGWGSLRMSFESKPIHDRKGRHHFLRPSFGFSRPRRRVALSLPCPPSATSFRDTILLGEISICLSRAYVITPYPAHRLVADEDLSACATGNRTFTTVMTALGVTVGLTHVQAPRPSKKINHRPLRDGNTGGVHHNSNPTGHAQRLSPHGTPDNTYLGYF